MHLLDQMNVGSRRLNLASLEIRELIHAVLILLGSGAKDRSYLGIVSEAGATVIHVRLALIRPGRLDELACANQTIRSTCP